MTGEKQVAGNTAEVSCSGMNAQHSESMDVISKGCLVPVILLVIAVAPRPEWKAAAAAGLLACGVWHLISTVSGRRKPWWAAAAAMGFTAILAATPLWGLWSGLWRSLYAGPGSVMEFVGAGLREQLFIALAVFLAYCLGRHGHSPLQRAFALNAPVDAIPIAVASGLGFAFSESIFHYAPGAYADSASRLAEAGMPLANATLLGSLAAFQSIFEYSLRQTVEHAAVSGCLGCVIGLGIWKPRHRWTFWATGLAGAVALHACWEAIAVQAPTAPAFLTVLAFPGLLAVILKMRQLRPGTATLAADSGVQPLAPTPEPHAAPVSRFSLVCVEGPLETSFPINESRLTIGRDPAQCGVVVPFQGNKISPQHCAVRLTSSGVILLEDCSSELGTFLESGERVMPGSYKRLRPGLRFYLGTPAVTFEIEENV